MQHYNMKFCELLRKHELATVMRSERVLCEEIVITIGPDGLAVKKGSALTVEHLHGLASRTCSQGSDGAGEEVDGPHNTHTDVYQPRAHGLTLDTDAPPRQAKNSALTREPGPRCLFCRLRFSRPPD